MNKRFLIAGIIVILVVGGVVYLLASRPDSKTTDNQQRTENNAQDTRPEASQTTTPGSYIDYEGDNTIAAASGTKLLFFHAPWCPQCRALEADIKAQGVPSGVTIIKVDYDSNQNLRQKYGVTLQTTVVKISDDGTLVEKFVAYDDPTLAAVTKELL